ncbi:MAG: hypothetical protein ACYS8W_09040 [Planctomycetota bacterium]|jgi:hypothetical protein
MSNWFTGFFSWLFGGTDEEESPQSDPNWRDAFAKYDPTFKGKIREIYDNAQSAEVFFTGLEDLQVSLEMKVNERENEKGDIDKEIFDYQKKIADGEVDKAEESKMLRRAERALMRAEKLNREVDELDTQYGMLMDFVSWLDEVVRKPEAAVEVNAVLWEKLRDGVSHRRAEFETSREAWREARKQVETAQSDRMADVRERLLAYGKSQPVADKTGEAPEKKDEDLVKEKLLSYGAEEGKKKEEKTPEKEPAAESEPEPEKKEPESEKEGLAEPE